MAHSRKAAIIYWITKDSKGQTKEKCARLLCPFVLHTSKSLQKKTKFFYQYLRDSDLPHSHNSSHSYVTSMWTIVTMS